MYNCSDYSSYNKFDYFDRNIVLRTALYNLSVPCPFDRENDTREGIFRLEAPSTFLIQVLRLAVASFFIIAILALYNSIEVLGQIVYSIASYSVHWVVYLLLIVIKSMVLIVLLPILHKKDSDAYALDTAGFISTNLLQLATIFVLYICLEHERRFRSPDYASIASLWSRNVPTRTKRQLLCNWPRAFALFFTLVSLLIFIVLVSVKRSELPFKGHSNGSDIRYCLNINAKANGAFGPLVWVWLFSVFKVRMCVFSMVICLLCIRRENFKLTNPAKVYLVLGLLFSMFEDIPNSIVTVIAFKTYTGDNHVCIGRVFNVYDVLQFLGIFSLVFFFLFIRSQYLRVEQESKLSMVGDMQRLLQVNGRRDVKYYDRL